MWKKYKTYFLVVAVLVVIFAGFLSKGKIDQLISEKMQENVTPDAAITVEQKIQTAYNYDKNRENFDFTFLEFGSTGCIACEQMKPVLETIKNTNEAKVNVVFLHIMKAESQDWIKYYGISAIPMQVLLNKEGKEFFRHYGFISTDDLLAEFRENKTL